MKSPFRRPQIAFRFTCAAVALLLAAAFAPRAGHAKPRLPAVIGSNMVLQRDTPLTIWGWADPGEEIEVAIGANKGVAKADDKGRWRVKLAPMKGSADPVKMTIRGTETIELTNILIGEVWLGSGQSNMQWSVAASKNKAAEIANAKFPNIRLFLVPLVPSGTPADDVKARWVECSPESVPTFSAVLYFFGREIHKQIDAPIGLIATSWGGTRIEPWIPPVGFDSQPDLQKERDQVKAALENFAKAPEPKPKHPLNSNGAPTGLYNGMIHPLAPFALRGMLWYQGESNLGNGMRYNTLMKGLIEGWRKVWGQGEFPFLFVQLAPFTYKSKETALPEIWEAQTETLKFPNTGMAVTTDITTIKDIHPPNKQEVGRRLALWALAKTYGNSDLVYSGPLYDSMTVDQNRARISFQHIGGGLISRDAKILTWFHVAGEDKKFYPALATIVDGKTVAVSSPKVAKPVAVRFGWNQIAEPNLANKEGLPASPFRTDKWDDAVMLAE
jgi:sialate O-acetylesterase